MEWKSYVCDCDNCKLRGGYHPGIKEHLVYLGIMVLCFHFF